MGVLGELRFDELTLSDDAGQNLSGLRELHFQPKNFIRTNVSHRWGYERSEINGVGPSH